MDIKFYIFPYDNVMFRMDLKDLYLHQYIMCKLLSQKDST